MTTKKSIRDYGHEAVARKKEAIALGLVGKSIKAIFRQEIVFWETRLRPFCDGDYYNEIQTLLSLMGHEVSHAQIANNLSVVAREIGFDRSTGKLDGRKATRRKSRGAAAVEGASHGK